MRIKHKLNFTNKKITKSYAGKYGVFAIEEVTL